MLASIPSRLLSEWMAFAELEPFGDERADLRAGIVASTIVNVNRAQGTPPVKPADFMPKFEEQVEPAGPDWETLLQKVEMLNAAYGGQDLRH